MGVGLAITTGVVTVVRKIADIMRTVCVRIAIGVRIEYKTSKVENHLVCGHSLSRERGRYDLRPPAIRRRRLLLPHHHRSYDRPAAYDRDLVRAERAGAVYARRWRLRGRLGEEPGA